VTSERDACARRHLFLSPHLDDAVLSCGALIGRLAWAGAVTVVTVFCGTAERPESTPLGRLFQERWNAGVNAMDGRRAEDRAAVSHLHACCRHLDNVDCIYRVDATGAALYPTVAAICRPRPEPELDRSISQQLGDLVDELRPSYVYAPLGIGRHADHMVVRRAVDGLLGERSLRADATLFWEDVPYVCHGEDATWQAELCGSLVASPLRLSGGHRKRAAVDAYRSQLRMLWWTAQAREDCLGGEAVGDDLFVRESLWSTSPVSIEILLGPR
jgi:LmbE family N-acetylglucosaminyl deacetylase